MAVSYTPYTYLTDCCGFKDIVSSASILNDLSYYYNHSISESELNNMIESVDSIISDTWKIFNLEKVQTKESLITNPIKMVNPENGFYKNVIKIDFKRAFTNYSVHIIPKEIYYKYSNICESVAHLRIFKSSKKFLYNYFLTNFILNYLGKDSLYNLREMVYNDVLYMAKRYGDIVKSEVDGCYVQTNGKIPDVKFDVFGEYEIQRFSHYFSIDRIQIVKLKDSDKVIIKGMSSNEPNIFKNTVKDILIKNNDSAIDDLFLKDNINILDWCIKSDDGNKISLRLKNTKLELNSIKPEDISGIHKYSSKIDREAYYKRIGVLVEKMFRYMNL